jgi:hypothetical protein
MTPAVRSERGKRMSSGSDYGFSMPNLRPREAFPTPLFKVTLPLLVLATAALAVWLLH